MLHIQNALSSFPVDGGGAAAVLDEWVVHVNEGSEGLHIRLTVTGL